MSETVVDPEVADVLQYETVDYFEDEENVTEKPVDECIQNTEEKVLEKDDLRNKLNMKRADRELLVELGLDPPVTNKSPEETQKSGPNASAEPAAPSCQARNLEKEPESPKTTQVPVPLSSVYIPQFSECDEEVSNLMTGGEYNLHSETDRAMIQTNQLPENTLAFQNARFGPMTYRDLDETDYSVRLENKKLKEHANDLEAKLYAANMELLLRRAESNNVEEFSSKTNESQVPWYARIPAFMQYKTVCRLLTEKCGFDLQMYPLAEDRKQNLDLARQLWRLCDIKRPTKEDKEKIAAFITTYQPN